MPQQPPPTMFELALDPLPLCQTHIGNQDANQVRLRFNELAVEEDSIATKCQMPGDRMAPPAVRFRKISFRPSCRRPAAGNVVICPKSVLVILVLPKPFGFG